MNNLTQTPEIEQLAEQVRIKKQTVMEYKVGFHRGALTYDELAQAGKELAAALFVYSKAKFPQARAKKIAYQSLIR